MISLFLGIFSVLLIIFEIFKIKNPEFIVTISQSLLLKSENKSIALHPVEKVITAISYYYMIFLIGFLFLKFSWIVLIYFILFAIVLQSVRKLRHSKVFQIIDSILSISVIIYWIFI